jgi:hypothetical protein
MDSDWFIVCYRSISFSSVASVRSLPLLGLGLGLGLGVLHL